MSTQDWTSDPLVFDGGDTRSLTVPGRVTWLRVDDVSGRPGNQLALSEVDLGQTVGRRLVLPDPPRSWRDAEVVVLRRLSDARSGCVAIEGDIRCAAEKTRAAEEPGRFARRFTRQSYSELPARMVVSPRAGAALDRLILRDQPVAIETSSTAVSDPRSGAVAIIDGTLSTTWIAGAGELHPEIRLQWLGNRPITGLDVSVARETAARLPETFEMRWPGGKRTVRVRDGKVRFPVIRTSQLTLRVGDAEPATNLGFDGAASEVPIGISELRLRGLPYLPVVLPTDARKVPCGQGPQVRAGLRRYDTRLEVSPANLMRGNSVEAQLCGGSTVRLIQGVNDVEVLPSEAFVGDSLVFGDRFAASALPNDSTLSGPVVRELAADDASVVTRENFNEGWIAAVDGEPAAGRIFDGWRQGWTSPETGTLTARFHPDGVYRGALFGGLLGVLAVALIGLLSRLARAPAVNTRPVPGWILLSSLPLVAGVLAGTPGVLAAAGGLAAARLLRRWAPEAGLLWVTMPIAGAALAYVFRPWGGSAGWAGILAWPQLCVVVAVVAASSWGVDWRGRRLLAKPIAGSSTKR